MGLFSKKKPKTLEDKHLSQAPQSLGGTTANEVYKTSYKKNEGFEGKGAQAGYFKEDTFDTVAKNAVGASSLAKGMGLGSLIPETKFATHDLTTRDGTKRTGVTGAVSKGAPGQALVDNVYDTDVHDQFLATTMGTNPGEIADDAKFKGYKEVNGRYMDLSGSEVNDIDLSNPTTQKGLNDLQWFDALIGNSDRHGGNILVDPTNGQVSGIDNDLSFGAGAFAKAGNKVDENFVKGNDDKMMGLPAMIDQDMAKKLLKLNEKKVAKMLNPKGIPNDQKMSDRELQQVYDRLAVIQDRVKEMKKNNQIVDQWDQQTYHDQINEDISGRKTAWNKDRLTAGSYLQRQHKFLQEAQDPSKTNMWRPGHRQADTAGVPAPVQQPPVQQPPVQQAPVQQAPVQQQARVAPQPPPQSAKPNRAIVQTNGQRAQPRTLPPQAPQPLPRIAQTNGQRAQPRVAPSSTDEQPRLQRRNTPKVLQNSPFKGY